MYFFLLLSNISLYEYTVICPFIVGILVYFQFLVIISQSSFVSIIKASGEHLYANLCVEIRLLVGLLYHMVGVHL